MRNYQPHWRVHWRDPQGPRTYKNPPTQESVPEGPNSLVGSGGSDWKCARAQQAALFPLGPLPHRQHPNTVTCVVLSGKYLRLRPLQCSRHVETKKYDPNERTDQSSRKRTKWQGNDILSNAEFKTLVIRMLTEMTEYRCKIEEEVKAMQSAIKKNIQGTNSERK